MSVNNLQKHKPERANLPLRERITELQDWLREEAEIKIRAANYHLATELYDLTLPGYISPHNEWIPRGDYLSDSMRYAKQQRDYWLEGLSAGDRERFRVYNEDYARFSIEELKQEIEGLNSILHPNNDPHSINN